MAYLVQFTDATTDVVIERLLLPDDVAEQAAAAHATYLAELNRHPVTAQMLTAGGMGPACCHALCVRSNWV